MFKLITLMRHGHYEFRDLSDLGKKQAADIATKLIVAKAVPQALISSPVPRAEQTARVLQDAFKATAGQDVPIKVFQWLHCDEFPAVKNFSDLDSEPETASVDDILVVTHQPQVESLSSYFNLHHSPFHAEARRYEVGAEKMWGQLRPDTAKLCREFKPEILSR